ncbi:DUF6124 family protein [Pseudomonas sp. H3(2019)]|uniref:DUF6124 family protein n=1 Tax=Pseudomonas sp. H3(2019) TaxID=2598724 RepID=UPI001194326F|nr:DUF6124 family protein [Pseudomonas sp. H3(2019)]TVT82022.1 hypothetical protein FPT12_17910 [Pseudomonas sp. H3(2019)]
MFKATPNPPEHDNVSPYDSPDSKKLHAAAHKALDHYLKPGTGNPRDYERRSLKFFAVLPDINNEALMAYTYETFCSVSTLILDLSDDLEDKHRNLALAIHQLTEHGLLLVEKALDNEYPIQPINYGLQL